jgi:Leucine-rich repeat (LRR) protein
MLPLLESSRKTPWEQARPWLAPAAITVWVVILASAALLYPDWQQGRLRKQLAEAGFVDNSKAYATSGLKAVFHYIGGQITEEKFLEGLSLLRGLRPPVDGLSFDYVKVGQPSLAGLDDLPKLKMLSIEGGPLKEMPRLKALESLFLNDPTSLNGIPTLPKLDILVVREANGLASLKGMPDLPVLRKFLLYGASGLRSLEGMPNLPALQTLSVAGATNLASLKGMPSLPALAELSVHGATRLISLEDMPAFPALIVLDLVEANSLASLAKMPVLPRLTTLDFSGASGLTREGPSDEHKTPPDLRRFESRTPLDLASLSVCCAPTLERLDLGPTPVAGDDYAHLARLTKLRDLGLYAARIKDLSALGQLRALETIDLQNVGDLDLSPLEHLPSLKTVHLSSQAKAGLRIPSALGPRIKWD